ncbi:MAG: hypothetical protein K5900_08980 [Butyrivibrio sp.]|nr:hypothetical protein [Butyrivibrio sp.]
MPSQDREELIFSLAKSMGVGESQKPRTVIPTVAKPTVEADSIFANGHRITKVTIEQAKSYFAAQYRKLSSMDDESATELASLYEVAMLGINGLLEDKKLSQ